MGQNFQFGKQKIINMAKLKEETKDLLKQLYIVINGKNEGAIILKKDCKTIVNE